MAKAATVVALAFSAATFLHPADSVHGDLGIVGTDDVAILISKGGESTELMALLEHLQRFGVRTVAITGSPQSALGRNCDVVLDACVTEEACPHDLAPTTSTTAALAVGDALAVALLLEKGFRREDFARIHPGGLLGKRLLTRVADVMVVEDLPVLARQRGPVEELLDIGPSPRGHVRAPLLVDSGEAADCLGTDFSSSATVDSFMEYSLPEAILKFRQGVGRLIRTKTDQGIVVVLDNRVLTKKYGQAFLDAAPKCPVEVV